MLSSALRLPLAPLAQAARTPRQSRRAAQNAPASAGLPGGSTPRPVLAERTALANPVEGQLDAFKRRFPGRSVQIDSLVNIIREPTDPTVPAVFVHGHPSTGKTAVISSLFRNYPPVLSVFINCVECPTQRLIYDRVLNAFAGVRPHPANGYKSFARCDNFNMFTMSLTELIRNCEREDSYQFHGWTRYLIFDRAERLRDTHPDLVPALMRFAQMSGNNVCMIFISSVDWEQFRGRNSGPAPHIVRFTNYSKSECINIAALDFPKIMDELAGLLPGLQRAREDTPGSLSPSKSSSSDDEANEDPEYRVDERFFRGFVGLIYDILLPFCQDLNELRHMVRLIFPKYVQPVAEKKVRVSEKSKLFHLVHGYIRATTQKIFRRDISTAEIMDAGAEAGLLDAGSDSTPQTKHADHLGIHVYAKFILLSSFLASYNPPRLDARYFGKTGITERRRRRRGRAANDTVLGGKNRQQLKGPKSFPVERMLAIFGSLINEPVTSDVAVYSQIATLVSLRYLSRVSRYDELDVPRFRCNISYDVAKRLAQDVRVDLDRYLHDFV